MADNEFPQIPGYRISKQIGRGGMAVVFLAEQERLDRPVAIKVMRPELDSDGSFGDRFLREARIVAKLTHPNILAIYDVGTAGSYHFMSMELVPGGDLKSRVRSGPIPIPEAINVTRQVAAALHFAHEHGFVHRDVKPENVLFRSNGTVVLSDFGIARAANDAATRMTVAGAVIGTPSYMSPEQIQGKELDGRSDLYSLGVMFFEILTGAIPYQGDSAITISIKHLRDPIPDLPAHLRRFQGIVNKMLAKAPADRYQSGSDIIRALDEIERNPDVAPSNAETELLAPLSGDTNDGGEAATVIQSRQGTASSTKPAGGRTPLFIGAAIIGMSAVAGIGYFSTRPETPGTEALTKTEQIAPAPVAPAVVEAPAPVAAPSPEPAAVDQNVAAEANAAAEEKKKQELERKLAAEKEKQRLAAEEKARREEADRRAADDKARRDDAERRAAAEKEQLRLAALEKSRQEEQDRRAREEKLNSLLNQARDYLDSGQLTESRASRALELYREAQRLAPSDDRAQQGPQRVAEAYGNLARTRSDSKQYDEAQALVLKGLELRPNDAQLLALQKSIEEKKNAKKSQRTFGGF